MRQPIEKSSRTISTAPVFDDALSHIGKRGRPVCLMKCLPGQRAGEGVCVGEEATAYDKIERRMQFEKKQLARLQGLERCSPRRPKVDLKESRLGSEKFKPIPIGHSDKKPNGHAIKVHENRDCASQHPIDLREQNQNGRS
jgi:hypothetical protein